MESSQRQIALRDPLLLRLTTRPEMVATILLVAMSVFLLAATPTFATQENILWICYSFSVIGIATIGLLPVLLTADIDFAIGAEIGLAAVVAGRIVFYDPNAPDAPVQLAFDAGTRTFLLERNAYFAGGRVDVYEIYHRPLY